MNAPQSPYMGRYQSPTGLGLALRDIGKTQAVYWDSFFNTWVVVEREHVLAALRDPNTFSNGAY